MAEEKDLTEAQEMFIEHLSTGKTVGAIAKTMGITPSSAYRISSELKEVIQQRTRDRLTLAGMKAANTVINSMDADGSMEKGELKLKAAEGVLDRIGVTKHTNVDVQIEAENGIFILPGKAEVTREDTPE